MHKKIFYLLLALTNVLSLKAPFNISHPAVDDFVSAHHEERIYSLEQLQTSIENDESIKHFFRYRSHQAREAFKARLIGELSNFFGDGFGIIGSELVIKIREALNEERAEELRKTQILRPEDRLLREVVTRVGEKVSQNNLSPHFYTRQSVEGIRILEDRLRRSLQNERISTEISLILKKQRNDDEEHIEQEDERLKTIGQLLEAGVLHAEALRLIIAGASTITLDLKTQPRNLVDAWRFWKEKGMSLADFLRVSKDANVDRSTQLVDPLTLHSFTLERATTEAFFRELGIEPTAVKTLASSSSSNFIELKEVIRFLTMKKPDLLFPRSTGEIYVNITKKTVTKKRSHDVLDSYRIFGNRKKRLRNGLN